MKKYRFAALLLLLLLIPTVLPVLSVGASSISASQKVADFGNMLTDAEEAELSRAIEEVERDCRVALRIVFWDMDASRSEYWGEDYMRDTGRSFSSDTILLIVTKDRGDYYYDLYLYGKPSHRLGRSAIDAVLDSYDVYLNLKGGELLAGSLAFVRQIGQRYDGSIRYVFTSVLPVALVISVLFTLTAVLLIVGRYRARVKAKNYPFNDFTRLQLTEQRDVFLGSTLRRVRLSSGNNGRGGGGSHGGGRGHAGHR